MPSVPIEMASDTVMVLKMIGLPPAPVTPSAAWRASPSMWTLHGVTWLHVEQTPTWDFLKSSRVKPTACSIARPGARSGPSSTSEECGRLFIAARFYRFRRFQGFQTCHVRSSATVPCRTAGTPGTVVSLTMERSARHLAGRRVSLQDPLRSHESVPARTRSSSTAPRPRRIATGQGSATRSRFIGRSAASSSSPCSASRTSTSAKAEARTLYEDRTPKPTPEEMDIRRMERIYRAAATPADPARSRPCDEPCAA